MFAKIGLMLAYLVSMFNMLMVNSFRYPQNIPYILNDMDVWLFPELQRAVDLLTEEEVPYEEEREVLLQNEQRES